MSRRSNCTELSACPVVWPNTPLFWCDNCREVARASAERLAERLAASEWSPGEKAIVDNPCLSHNGKPVWLAIRGVHPGTGEACWSARDEPNGKATLVFTESSLRKPPPVLPIKVPDAPAWNPGDPAVSNDSHSPRKGQTVWLVERGLGLINGRPYWTYSLTEGGPAFASESEDSLERPVISMSPTKIPGPSYSEDYYRHFHGEDRAPACPDGQANTSSLKSPSPELDPIREFFDERREPVAPEPVQMGADPGEFLKTPFFNPDRRGKSFLPAFFRIWKLGVEQGLKQREGQPSVSSVMEGIGRWQSADPQGRWVKVSVAGHSVHGTITLRSTHATNGFKFCSTYTAEKVVTALDELARVGAVLPDAEITMAKNEEVRFIEDTGDIEP